MRRNEENYLGDKNSRTRLKQSRTDVTAAEDKLNKELLDRCKFPDSVATSASLSLPPVAAAAGPPPDVACPILCLIHSYQSSFEL